LSTVSAQHPNLERQPRQKHFKMASGTLQPSATHPPHAYGPAPTITLQELKQHLQMALDRGAVWQKRRLPYRTVKVLSVTWDNDRVCDQSGRLWAHSKRLAHVFCNSYHYDTMQCVLPASSDEDTVPSAAQTLINAMYTLLKGVTRSDLIIIHYVGRTTRYSDARHLDDMWLEPANGKTKVNLSAIRRECFGCDSASGPLTNGVVLLDGVALDDAKEQQLQAPADPCFTTLLAELLEHAANTDQVLTTSSLFAYLATTQKGIQRHCITPGSAPLVIAPLISASPSLENQPRVHDSLARHPASVILSATLQTSGFCHDFPNWMPALESLLKEAEPPGQDCIELLNMIRPSPNEAIITFEVTVGLWDCLPDHPAVKFMSYTRKIERENLMTNGLIDPAEAGSMPVGFVKMGYHPLTRLPFLPPPDASASRLAERTVNGDDELELRLLEKLRLGSEDPEEMDQKEWDAVAIDAASDESGSVHSDESQFVFCRKPAALKGDLDASAGTGA